MFTPNGSHDIVGTLFNQLLRAAGLNAEEAEKNKVTLSLSFEIIDIVSRRLLRHITANDRVHASLNGVGR